MYRLESLCIYTIFTLRVRCVDPNVGEDGEAANQKWVQGGSPRPDICERLRFGFPDMPRNVGRWHLCHVYVKSMVGGLLCVEGSLILGVSLSGAFWGRGRIQPYARHHQHYRRPLLRNCRRSSCTRHPTEPRTKQILVVRSEICRDYG